MKVGHIRNYIAGMKDDEEIIALFYDRSEADEHIENNLSYLENDEIKETPPLTEDEWIQVIRIMDRDDSLWQDLSEAWRWSIEKVIEERKKSDNSK